MKARIRDFVQTADGWIFSVADYDNIGGIRGLLRYVPDPEGPRKARGKRYRKLDFDEAYQFLRRVRPEYVSDLHVVPDDDIVKVYRPSEELPRVCDSDPRVRLIADILQEGGVPRDRMGITGSMLLDLQGPSSDIDFVVYGPCWWRARDLIRDAKAEGRLQDLDTAMWRRIYDKRKPETGFDEFVLHEARKGNRGVVGETYFDLLFTRDWNQIKPLPPGRAVGLKEIRARVLDADFSFDSPAILEVDGDVGVVLSFSHTYAGQALPGEEIAALGVLEETDAGQRLVVGTTREARGEWIRSLTLLSGGR